MAYSPDNNIKTVGEGADGKPRGMGGTFTRKRAEKRLKKSAEYRNNLRKENVKINKKIDSLIKG